MKPSPPQFLLLALFFSPSNTWCNYLFYCLHIFLKDKLLDDRKSLLFTQGVWRQHFSFFPSQETLSKDCQLQLPPRKKIKPLFDMTAYITHTYLQNITYTESVYFCSLHENAQWQCFSNFLKCSLWQGDYHVSFGNCPQAHEILTLKRADLFMQCTYHQFSSVLSRVRLFGTPRTAARQASLSITNSWSLLRLMPIESVMPSSRLILCHPLLLLSVPYTSK